MKVSFILSVPDAASARKSCGIPTCQAQKLSFSPVKAFLDNYWSLTDEERGFLLRSSQTTVEGRQRNHWYICGARVCFSRFCQIIGSSQRTVRNLLNGRPNMQKKGIGGEKVKQPKMATQMAKCHVFFQQLHQSSAVPDPDAKLPGTAACAVRACQQRHALGPDPWDDWTYKWEDAGPLTAAVQAHTMGLPIRTVGHTTLAAMYWQFGSEWTLSFHWLYFSYLIFLEAICCRKQQQKRFHVFPHQ